MILPMIRMHTRIIAGLVDHLTDPASTPWTK
jgi:hypothetical protein